MAEARSKLRTDGQATRERILEAAGELIGANGYAQTTAKAVADRAEVSLTLINYHFGGREGLYRAVLIEAHRRLGPVCNRLGGGLRVAISADEFTCCFQDALSGRLPICTEFASGLGHRVLD